MLRRNDALAGSRGCKLDAQCKIMKGFMIQPQNNNKISVFSENGVSKSCLKLYGDHEWWCNAEGILCIFLSSIYLHKSKGYVLYCQLINHESWLPAPGGNVHTCTPPGLAFKQVKMWAAVKCLQIFPALH